MIQMKLNIIQRPRWGRKHTCLVIISLNNNDHNHTCMFLKVNLFMCLYVILTSILPKKQSGKSLTDGRKRSNRSPFLCLKLIILERCVVPFSCLLSICWKNLLTLSLFHGRGRVTNCFLSCSSCSSLSSLLISSMLRHGSHLSFWSDVMDNGLLSAALLCFSFCIENNNNYIVNPCSNG